ncbi:homocysteine S-methyltransferase family protein [Actinosynnema sp. NPDC049800]
MVDVITSDVARQARRGHHEAGADVVKTNTFGADPVERDVTEKIVGLSRRGAELAREAVPGTAPGSSSTRPDRAPTLPPSVTLRA